jgi:hypothetical protein
VTPASYSTEGGVICSFLMVARRLLAPRRHRRALAVSLVGRQGAGKTAARRMDDILPARAGSPDEALLDLAFLDGDGVGDVDHDDESMGRRPTRHCEGIASQRRPEMPVPRRQCLSLNVTRGWEAVARSLPRNRDYSGRN